jgi:hypothetical protein
MKILKFVFRRTLQCDLAYNVTYFFIYDPLLTRPKSTSYYNDGRYVDQPASMSWYRATCGVHDKISVYALNTSRRVND